MSTARRCYLGLGSNLGDREVNLTAALARLSSLSGVEVEQVSSVYETAPWGVADQPPFLNLVVQVSTTLSPLDLLHACQEIEAGLGRVREERWGPRTMDVDLLWHEGVVCASPELTLPHPLLAARQFVLAPLAEIAPELALPDGRRVLDLVDPAAEDVSLWSGPPS